MSALDDVLAGLSSDDNEWGPPSGTDSTPLWQTFQPSKKKKGKNLWNVLQGALNVASVPLHVVTGSTATIGRGIGELAGADYGENNVSLRNLWDMIYHPSKAIDFGDIVSGNPEKGINASLFSNDFGGKSIINWDAPTPVRIATGLAGDIALDPLTYLGAAGKVHGAQEAAGHIAQTASEQIAREGGFKLSDEVVHEILTKSKPIDEIVKVPPETALRIEEIRNAAQDAVYAARRGGASALTAEQLAQFGTNEAGRTLSKGLALDFGRLGQIRLTSGEGPLSQLSIIRHKAQMQLGDMLLGKPGELRALGKLNGAPELNALARSGAAGRTAEAPLSMMDATIIKRLRASTRAVAETATKEAQRATVEAIKGYSDDEIRAAHEIIDSGGETLAAASPREQELAQKLSAAFEKHGEQLVKAGVLPKESLLKAGTYFPSPITQDAREAMIAAGLHPEGAGGNAVKGFIEGQRKLWDPTTGKGGIGVDSETTQRIGFTAKTRAEAEVKASQELAKALKAAADNGSEAATKFIAEHPEAVDLLESGKYPLFQEGREALLAQTRAIGRRVAQAQAGRKLFEAGYGIVDPRYAKGFVDYGPTAEEVQRMLRLGQQSSETAVDRAAAAREMDLTAREMQEAAAGGVTQDMFAGSEAANEARLARASQTASEAPLAEAPPTLPNGATLPDIVGDVERRTAERAAEVQRLLPEQPEGTVRLFNRGNTNWWNEGLVKEALAGPPEDLRYLDVTPQELRQMKLANQASAADHGILVDETLDESGRLTALMNRAKPVVPEAEPSQSAIEQAMASLSQYAERGKAAPAKAERAYETVVHTELDRQMREGFNEVERTMDDIRAYFKNRTVFKGPRVAGKIDPDAVTGHFDQLQRFLKDLQLREPSSFGYADPLAEPLIPGFNPAGSGRTAHSLQARAAEMEKLLKEQVRDFERNPTAYAAKARARVEGQLAEDAARARVGADLPDKTLVPERRRPWTFEEKQGHRRAYAAVKQLGGERGAALQEVKAAEREVADIARRGPVPLETHTANIEQRVLKLEQERDALAEGLARKERMDLADARREAERQANEAPVGSPNEFESENLARWAERNAQPVEHTEIAEYARENQPVESLQNDRMVTDMVQRRIEAIDQQIERMRRVDRIHAPGEIPAGTKGPATDLDLAKARLEDARARLKQVDSQLEAAKEGLRPKGSDVSYAPPSGKQVEEATPGGPYEAALNEFHAKIMEKNAKPVEPHLESREAYVHGDRPFRDIETGETIKEGTLQEAVSGIDPEVVQKRADKIREDWKRFGRTENDHRQMAQAFEDYHGQLDKYIKPSVERDMVAQSQHQVDALGRLAQSEAHVSNAVDDIVADAQAVAGVDPSVVPEQVQTNFAQRAVEAQELQTVAQQAKASGEFAREEIAHMRIVANKLANDADMYRANAREWLHEWNSITTERSMHSAVNSLLVQGEVDWLAHTALQRGILTPRGVADALLYTEHLATPEGANRLAQSWRSALHWMRVWQITSPGFHVRNLFGGIFNNALAGVDAATYPRFAKLWRKASRGGELTADEARRWEMITSHISPGQIGSEALGNPAARLMGEAAVSKTPWGQLGTHGILPRVSENAGANVEFFLRGSLMDDVISKGGSVEDAVEAVNKFHFDYHDASATEQWIKANAVPFLTWTRHNVPLQLQMMVENPRPYARFAHFKREVEARSTADPVVPGYFADITAVRLPFQTGKGHAYYIPDLPFRDVGLVTEPIQQLVSGEGDFGDRALAAFGEPIGMTTPLISGPVEWMLGKQFFKGIPLRDDRGIKMRDLHIPEWLAAPLRLTPLVKKGDNGQSYITERDFYILEKMLPVLGRARRLGGSGESKQQDKLMSHLISFFAGTQVRTNTEEDQKIANYLSTLETKRKSTINNGLTGAS